MPPNTIAPMLAQAVSEPFDSDSHLYEIKWDGTRALLFVDEDNNWRLQNRRFEFIHQRFPEFEDFSLLPSGTVLDGEVVVLEQGKSNFQKLQQREHLSNPTRIQLLSEHMPATFVAFDLLYVNNRNYMNDTLINRRTVLEQLAADTDLPNLLVPNYIIKDGRRYFDKIERAGLEGVMAKQVESIYLPGIRSANWLKIKVARQITLTVIGYIKRDGEKAVSALLLGELDNDTWRYRGKVGSGFNETQRHAMYDTLSQFQPLANPPETGPANGQWVSPRLKAHVRYMEQTESGKLRSPVFKGFVDT